MTKQAIKFEAISVQNTDWSVEAWSFISIHNGRDSDQRKFGNLPAVKFRR